MRDFRTQFAIDKAADGERVEPLKRAALSPEDALNALKLSIQSGMEDDAILDKSAWRAEQTAAYNNYVAKNVVAFKKGAIEMSSLHDETIRAISKNVCERNAPPVFSKSAYITAIAKRADEIKKAGESTQQAFARAITQDSVGQLLYRASKVAPGPEIEPAPIPELPKPSDLGPAHAKMQVLADDHLKANPRKTPAGAYAACYSDPKNAELREQCKAEHLAAISKAMAA